MAITFAYTEATNTVVVTEGTAGTPATFADFVTADRAGTDTDLLVAGSPASDLALTYAVRPVEDLAILVKCIVANKTAEADFIFITGKDWRGAAQTESIDVTAGNGSYTTTKYWSEITTLDCSDGAAGGGAVWDDGDLSVTQDIWGVIWDYGNSSQYQIDAHFHIGNGSTTTHFQSSRDMVYIKEHMEPETKADATLTLGSIANSEVETGSYWSIDGNSWTSFCYGGTLNIYGSIIEVRTSGMYLSFYSGDLVVKRSMIDMEGRVYLRSTLTSANLDRLYISQGQYVIFQMTPDSLSYFAMNNISNYFVNENAPITLTNMDITNFPANGISVGGAANPITEVDPIWAVDMDKVATGQADEYYMEKYTCNITVADKDGTLLDGVEVLCEDEADAQAFTTTTGDTDTGKIDEQQIEYRRKTNPEVVTTYSPHKFTLSKAGYETLILDAVTVDGPIDWHLELQASKQPPAPWQEGMM